MFMHLHIKTNCKNTDEVLTKTLEYLWEKWVLFVFDKKNDKKIVKTKLYYAFTFQDIKLYAK